MTKTLLELEKIPASASLIAVATHRLSRLLRAQLGKVLAQCGGMSIAEWRILAGLDQQDGITQKHLIEFTKIEQGQLSRALAAMEERKLISSTRSDEDRRARIFSMTDKGRIFFEQILPSVTAHNRALDAAFSREEKALFLEMVARLAETSQQSLEEHAYALRETS
ncbi:MarR family transcriptional regulator [Nitratireductor sp. XY-223]|uniref:MarR family winged helix-turn-helix transcriptional regulator n=1 Tax=Nitratireductor sp. XY-223 TaxID=2561926 RepID=UPI0010AA95F5|nr:MarR family transcriptional regulator [Nitratireductor sp. XY-223]